MARLGRRPASESDGQDFRPIRILEVELGEELAELEPMLTAEGKAYESAWCLVRLHSRPLGMVEISLPPGPLSASAFAAAIWDTLGSQINAHLRMDGLREAQGLTERGLPSDVQPNCLATRDEYLRNPGFLSVVIPTRDRPERLGICLESILRCRYPESSYEIVIVDNAPSSDATRRFIEERYGHLSRIRYIREDQPGSASARNTGLQVVRGEIVVFTDDDVRVDAHWLTEIARGFGVAPEVACVSGLLMPMELDTPAQIWFEQYGGFSRGFERRIYDLDEHRPRDNALYPYSAGIFGTGNNFAFRRSVLSEIGNFDPALGNGTPALGGVDSEALLRTIVTGHRIVYEPAALVYHAHRRDYPGLKRQVYSYGVGLSAYLLKTMLAHPRLLPDFLSRLPSGLRFALGASSGKNERKTSSYPRELTRLELRGMLWGPIAYVRSRRQFGPHRTPGQRQRWPRIR